jgi:hypothetical protein
MNFLSFLVVGVSHSKASLSGIGAIIDGYANITTGSNYSGDWSKKLPLIRKLFPDLRGFDSSNE